MPLSPASPVRDQAYVVPFPVAKAAVTLLRRSAWMVSYCEPCGDDLPVRVAVGSVGMRAWEADPALWVVEVNGEGVDLAYTYAWLDGTDQWANVARLTAAPGVDGVSAVVVLAPERD